MAVTIIEALQSAKLNLDNTNQVPSLTVPLVNLAKAQLYNSIILLEKGYDIFADIDSLIDEYGKVENVPDLSDVL